MTTNPPLEVNAEGMYIVADFIDALNEKRCNSSHVSWRAEDVRFVAKQFEAAEAAKRAEEDRVEDLAQGLRQAISDPSGTSWITIGEDHRETYRVWARALIEKGWTRS